MLHSQLAAPSQCIIRHCVMGGVVQPVYFSLTLIRDRQRLPAGFTCTILPVLSCDCTGNCNGRWDRGDRVSCSRKCSGQLRSKEGQYYLICNPPDTIPCCSRLVGAIADAETGQEEKCKGGCAWGVCWTKGCSGRGLQDYRITGLQECRSVRNESDERLENRIVFDRS